MLAGGEVAWADEAGTVTAGGTVPDEALMVEETETAGTVASVLEALTVVAGMAGTDVGGAEDGG